MDNQQMINTILDLQHRLEAFEHAFPDVKPKIIQDESDPTMIFSLFLLGMTLFFVIGAKAEGASWRNVCIGLMTWVALVSFIGVSTVLCLYFGIQF
jgi:hypothetical protein